MLPFFYWHDQLEQSATEPSEVEFLFKEVFRGIFAIASVFVLLAVLAIDGELFRCADKRPQALRNYRYGIDCGLFSDSIVSRSLRDVRPTSVRAARLAARLSL